jgi:hypothetical protein
VYSRLSTVYSRSLRLSDRGYQIKAIRLKLRTVSKVVEIGWGYVASYSCDNRGYRIEAT